MKRRCLSLIIVICLVSVVVVGCVGNSAPDTSPDYKFGTDCQYYNAISVSPYFLAESEDSLFYLDVFSYLHVIDKKEAIDTVFCDKPDCLHGDDDSHQTMEERAHCKAYMGGASNQSICYYDGALYSICSESKYQEPHVTRTLRRYSLDGTGQKDIWELEWGKNLDSNVTDFVIHRGKVYFLNIFIDTVEKDPETGMGLDRGQFICSYDLKSKKMKRLYQFDDDIFPYANYNLHIIGDNLYVQGNRAKEADSLVVRYNISSGAVTELDYCKQMFLVGDCFVSYFAKQIKEVDGEKSRFDHWLTTSPLGEVNTQERKAIQVDENPEYIKQFQAYGNFLFAMDGMFDDYSSEIRVYDFTKGEKITTLPLPEFDYGGTRVICCTMDGRLFLYNTIAEVEDIRDNVSQFFCCNISDIGTDNFQWQEVEKVN